MNLDIVHLSVRDLGFDEGALTREILGTERDRNLFGHPAPFTCGRGSQLGLELCPPDVGPELRLQYKNQPQGERLYIAMRPIPTDDGEPRIFFIEHNEKGMSLDAARARPDDAWAASDVFVFCLRGT